MKAKVLKTIAQNSDKPSDQILKILKHQIPNCNIATVDDINQLIHSPEYNDLSVLLDISVRNDNLEFTVFQQAKKQIKPLEEVITFLNSDDSQLRDFLCKVKQLSPEQQLMVKQRFEHLQRQEEAFYSYSYNPAQSSIIQQQQENELETSHIPAELVANEKIKKNAQLKILNIQDKDKIANKIIGVTPKDLKQLQLHMRDGTTKVVDTEKISKIPQLAEKVIGFLNAAVLLIDQ